MRNFKLDKLDKIVKSTEIKNQNYKLIKSMDLSNEELNLINKFTLHPLSKEELFTFNIELCSNEIDRECESFTKSTIQELAKMFIDKPCIYDHNANSKNQTARIYATEIIEHNDERTKFGEPKISLIAKAYTIKCDEFKNFIQKISAGILREISISCQIKNKICSICNQNYNNCHHEINKIYDNQICFIKLVKPLAAYECSFVTIPAQPCAKIIKTFSLNDTQKSNDAAISKQQINNLCQQVKKLGFLCGFGENEPSCFNTIIKKLNFEELQNIKYDLENILKNSNFNHSLTEKTKTKNENSTEKFLEYLI